MLSKHCNSTNSQFNHGVEITGSTNGPSAHSKETKIYVICVTIGAKWLSMLMLFFFLNFRKFRLFCVMPTQKNIKDDNDLEKKMEKVQSIHKAPTACVIRMLENAIFHSMGVGLDEIARTPNAVQTFTIETKRTLLDGVMHVLLDNGTYMREVEDMEQFRGKIMSFSCDQDGKNVAALSFMQNRLLFFHVEFDLCHRYAKNAHHSS